ncbi:MAG: hypothetical protein D3921_13105 [Candidatus Electrothrix sp. AW1]|nr:hypothetical protein [Candidatus Electrothrix sp. AX1]MCI5179921.1 hypothetical protein [Candidatus Electrothrix gigas]MCI5183429.1 hypothetical protein [Candidatus Electrothrix gigas]
MTEASPSCDVILYGKLRHACALRTSLVKRRLNSERNFRKVSMKWERIFSTVPVGQDSVLGRICIQWVTECRGFTDIFHSHSAQENEFLLFILDHYIEQGISELDQENLPDLLELKYHSLGDALDTLGSISDISQLFVGFQGALYQPF